MTQGAFLKHILLVAKLGQLPDISKGNNFHEFFEELRELGPNSRSFSN